MDKEKYKMVCKFCGYGIVVPAGFEHHPDCPAKPEDAPIVGSYSTPPPAK